MKTVDIVLLTLLFLCLVVGIVLLVKRFRRKEPFFNDKLVPDTRNNAIRNGYIPKNQDYRRKEPFFIWKLVPDTRRNAIRKGYIPKNQDDRRALRKKLISNLEDLRAEHRPRIFMHRSREDLFYDNLLWFANNCFDAHEGNLKDGGTHAYQKDWAETEAYCLIFDFIAFTYRSEKEVLRMCMNYLKHNDESGLKLFYNPVVNGSRDRKFYVACWSLSDVINAWGN